MKKNTKDLFNNYTIEQYFKPSLKPPSKDKPNIDFINVPPSSGHPATFLPENVVLVVQILSSDILLAQNGANTNKKSSVIVFAITH